jgi:hypothetical protein
MDKSFTWEWDGRRVATRRARYVWEGLFDPEYGILFTARGTDARSVSVCVLTVILFFVQTVESFYILWRTTGDVKWRHRGWRVFQAIQRYTKTDSGYSSVENVDTAHPTPSDSMPR